MKKFLLVDDHEIVRNGLKLVMKELTIPSIADKPGIGISTTATHKARLFEKLRIKSVAELIKLSELYGRK